MRGTVVRIAGSSAGLSRGRVLPSGDGLPGGPGGTLGRSRGERRDGQRSRIGQPRRW